MGNLVHFLNGKFVTDDGLFISPRDLGFARGYTVYDFLVTYNNQPFKLNEHIERLFRSAEIIELQIPWSKKQITTWVKETLNKNNKETEKTVAIYLTGGIGNYMYQAEEPTLIMIISPKIERSLNDYKKGIKVKAIKYRRPYPEAKTNFYIEGVRQLAKIKNDNIAEIIYYDDLQVFEGAGTNLFAVIDNKLVTPKSNILYGITRNTLLEILQLDIPVKVQNFTFNQLLNASEIFLTGSYSQVRGVIEINGRVIGNGKVGKITKEVTKQFTEYILQSTS